MYDNAWCHKLTRDMEQEIWGGFVGLFRDESPGADKYRHPIFNLYHETPEDACKLIKQYAREKGVKKAVVNRYCSAILNAGKKVFTPESK